MSLTAEDKAWITEQLRTVLTEQLRGVATVEQLRGLATVEHLRGLATVEQLSGLATLEQLRAVETSLLTEFHKWASPNEARQRTHAAALRAVDLEMESLSERVAKIETKQSPS
jgi:hypothetical protein